MAILSVYLIKQAGVRTCAEGSWSVVLISDYSGGSSRLTLIDSSQRCVVAYGLANHSIDRESILPKWAFISNASGHGENPTPAC